MEEKKRIHIYIAMIVLFASIFALGIFKIQGYDIWFHLKTGEYVLNNFSIPYSDPFSYAAELPWIAHSWLAGVLFWIATSVSGLPGLIIFNAILISFYLFLVFFVAEKKAGVFSAVLLTFLAALAIRGAERFFVRPDVFSLLFTSAYLFVFYNFKQGKRDAIYLIPLLQLLWSSLHGGGAPLGLGLLGVYFGGEILESFLKDRRILPLFKDRDLKTLIFVLASSFFLSFANPYGSRVILYFTHSWGQEFSAILEWRATSFSDFLGAYGLIMILAFCSIILFFKRFRLSEILIFFVLAVFSFRAIRLIPFAVLSAVPIVALGVSEASKILSRKFEKLKKIPATVLGIFVILTVLVSTYAVISVNSGTFGSVYRFGLGMNKEFYPIDAVRFVEENDLKGRMFNNYGFGGYLIWRFFPERKVFVDGRFDIYGEEFIARYRRFPFKGRWDELAEKYGFTFALVDNEPTYICRNLDSDPKWVLVFWDDRSLVYVKNIPQNRNVIDKYRYVYLKPNNRDLNYLDPHIRSQYSKERLKKEMMRSFEDGRESLNARLMLAYIYEKNKGEHQKAISEYKAIIKKIPDWGELYKKIGILYMWDQNFEEALPYLKDAVRLDPTDLEGHNSLSVAYFLLGNKGAAIKECKRVLRKNPYDKTALMNLKIFEGKY